MHNLPHKNNFLEKQHAVKASRLMYCISKIPCLVLANMNINHTSSCTVHMHKSFTHNGISICSITVVKSWIAAMVSDYHCNLYSQQNCVLLVLSSLNISGVDWQWLSNNISSMSIPSNPNKRLKKCGPKISYIFQQGNYVSQTRSKTCIH